MAKIKLQLENLSDGTRPYPYWINDDLTVENPRETLTVTQPMRLIAFSYVFSDLADDVALTGKEFLRHPARVIGLYPVFSDENGEFFTVGLTVASVSGNTKDGE